jgi:hypothetical protein
VQSPLRLRAHPSLTLERIDCDACDWSSLVAYPDRYVSQRREWVEFVAETQRAEPVVAAVRDGAETVGYFTGLVLRKLGIPILGSPFPGWTTPYMGFNLAEGVPRRAALEALLPFAFRTLGCLHVEVKDRLLTLEDGVGLGLETTLYHTFEVDLRRTEEEIWAGFSSACRRAIRKAEKEGVVVEEASDLEFADDYYAQLRDVFAKQSLVPTYDLERVRALIRHLYPTDDLLLLRARDSDGLCIGTAIFPAMNRTAFFWGGASWRSHQILRPNEPIFWHALRYWRARGMDVLDTGGGGEYKRKYGVTEVTVPFFRCSRLRALSLLRTSAKRAVRARQLLLGRV